MQYRVCLELLWEVEVLCIRMIFFFQAEDGIRDLVRSRGLGDVYKRQDIFGQSLFVSFYLIGHSKQFQNILVGLVTDGTESVSYTHLTLPTIYSV